MIMKIVWSALLLTVSQACAATYYVNTSNGSDTNNGTSKTSAWAHAPGIEQRGSGTAKATTIRPGDSIILRGCRDWGNASFPWVSPASGSSGSPIYIGVDQTWYDSTVSSCASSWNRPILNPGATSTNHGSNSERIILDTQSYVTWDNFEIVNVLCADDAAGTSNETHIFRFVRRSIRFGCDCREHVYPWLGESLFLGRHLQHHQRIEHLDELCPAFLLSSAEHKLAKHCRRPSPPDSDREYSAWE